MANFTPFGELIGNGKFYQVPSFQRDYAWGQEEWEDLWLDILDLTTEKKHYMGYVVLQSEIDSSKRFTIIDGQQRFATLSIIYLAGTMLLDDWSVQSIDASDNQIRKTKLTERFLSNTPASSLIPTSKIRLNRNNNDTYQSYLMGRRRPQNVSKLKASDRNLLKSYDYFYEKLKEKFAINKSGQELAKFLEDDLADGLEFTVIEVQSDLNAFKVFETLNARGVKLSTADLLKNYLFSVAFNQGSAEIEETERQWQRISDLLGGNDFTNFLRHFWNSRYPLERSLTLFKAIKKTISTPNEVFGLLNALENAAHVYIAFGNAVDPLWRSTDESKAIAEINLFNISQCYPLLLISYEQFSNNSRADFIRILKAITIISFRYLTISGQNPNEMEAVYNKISQKIAKKNLTNSQQIIIDLMPLYVPDEVFRTNFANKELTTNSGRNKKLIRYILFRLENQIAETDYYFEDNTVTIEHILPENAGVEWEAFFKPNEQEQYVFALGNYTLLEKSKNSDAGTKLFENKYPIYQTSKFKITSEHLNVTEWSPTILKKRQTQMAKWACAVWKI